MRRYATSLQRSARTLRQFWWIATGKMTMCIFWWNTRLKWRCPIWSIASRACPHVVSGNSIQPLLDGTTRAFCGLQVTLLPHVEAHRCPSFVSTLKSNGKICECFALNLLYPRPERRGWIRSPKALLRGGRGCPSASCRPPRRAGDSVESLRGDLRLGEHTRGGLHPPPRCAHGLRTTRVVVSLRRPSHMVLGEYGQARWRVGLAASFR